MWRHGRAWLYFGRGNRRNVLGFEWRFLDIGFGLSFELDPYGEHHVHFGFKVPLIALYLNFECYPLAKKLRKLLDERKELSIKIHDNTLWVVPWIDDDDWYKGHRPWTFHFVDFLLGKPKHSTRIIEERGADRPVIIPMPEASYAATAKLTEDVWKRSRWPFSKRILRVDLQMVTPIPVPGKGENGYDQEDDSTHGFLTPAKSIEEGIGHLVASVLKRRKRHGGTSWSPEIVSELARKF